MKVISVNKLGLEGVNFDYEPCDLPINVFTYGKNYRLLNGYIEAFNGSTLLFSSPYLANLSYIDFVQDITNQYYLLLGRSKNVIYNGSSWFDITSTDMTTNPLPVNGEFEWNSCRLGKIPIINNKNHYPEYWSPQQTTQVLQPLKFNATQTWKQKGYRAKVIRAHREFLFALNLTEGSTELPTAYRWSHPADINGLPPSWDETDLSYIASKEQISGNSGEIVDGLSLRDSFVIYSKFAINILDFVGGEFVFNRRELSANYGLLTDNCIQEINGTHFFLTDGDILRTDGNQIESILHNKFRKRITSTLSTSNYDKSFSLKKTEAKEVWFCLVEEGASLPSFAFIYNWSDGTISERALDKTMSHAIVAPLIKANRTWSSPGLWADETKTWDYNVTSPFTNTIIAINPTTNSIYDLETNVSVDSTVTIVEDWTVSGPWTSDTLKWNESQVNIVYGAKQDLNTFLERTSFTFSQSGSDHFDVTTITRCYPHIISDGSVYIQLGSQDFYGAPISWKPAVKFTPKTMRKVDIRTTGKLHSWRISSIGSDKFRLSGLDFEYENNGVR